LFKKKIYLANQIGKPNIELIITKTKLALFLVLLDRDIVQRLDVFGS
jgi:hypothetical protein